MPLWFEKDPDQGLTAAGSIGVAQSRIGRAQRLTPPVFGLVAVALSRFGRAIVVRVGIPSEPVVLWELTACSVTRTYSCQL